MPRAQTRATDTDGRTDKVTAATSSTSLYDNVGATQTGSTQGDVCDKTMLAIGALVRCAKPKRHSLRSRY